VVSATKRVWRPSGVVTPTGFKPNSTPITTRANNFSRTRAITPVQRKSLTGRNTHEQIREEPEIHQHKGSVSNLTIENYDMKQTVDEPSRNNPINRSRRSVSTARNMLSIGEKPYSSASKKSRKSRKVASIQSQQSIYSQERQVI
jgi:hypothetical protein